jgi:uncharacterized protein
MDAFKHFSIPYLGLKAGLHEFKFEIDNTFFQHFESSPISEGSFKISLEVDKRPDFGVMELRCLGQVVVTCERCLNPFSLPQDTEATIHIKYGEENIDDDEVIYITHDTSHLNVAQIIYEIIVVSLPMLKMHEDEQDCDPEVIKRMKKSDLNENTGNPFWESLKGFESDN